MDFILVVFFRNLLAWNLSKIFLIRDNSQSADQFFSKNDFLWKHICAYSWPCLYFPSHLFSFTGKWILLKILLSLLVRQKWVKKMSWAQELYKKLSLMNNGSPQKKMCGTEKNSGCRKKSRRKESCDEENASDEKKAISRKKWAQCSGRRECGKCKCFRSSSIGTIFWKGWEAAKFSF